MPLEVRRLGNTHRQASLLGLGGNRLLATPDRFEEACQLIGRALDLGVSYFDTARLYPESEVYLGQARERQDPFPRLPSVSYACDWDDARASRRHNQARSSAVSAPVATTSTGKASSSAAFTATAATNGSGAQSDAA